MPKVKVVCDRCGKEFYKYPSRVSKKNYCSRECYNKSRIGDNNPNWKGGLVTLYCENCGKPFKVKPYLVGKRKCCSRECQAELNKSKFAGENNPNYKGKIAKVCPQCGKTFYVFPSRYSGKKEKKYCSKECMIESHYTVRRCRQCGREFRVRKGDKSKYCSKECRIKSRIKTVTKLCEWCGKPMVVKPSVAKRQRFCSVECKHKWFASGVVRGSNNPRWNGGKVTLYCEYCGKPYQVPRHRASDSHFCSYKCKYAGRSGKNSPNWKGGRPKYRGANWQEQREKALARDDYICQLCGSKEYLVVHHIVPFHSFDDYREANRLDNLITLCQVCHGKVEHVEEYKRKLQVKIRSCNILQECE